jgi:hypothetical protein
MLKPTAVKGNKDFNLKWFQGNTNEKYMKFSQLKPMSYQVTETKLFTAIGVRIKN